MRLLFKRKVSTNLICGGTRWDDISSLRLQACNLVPWLFHMCAMTFPHVWHNSITCVPWLIHMCAMYCQLRQYETISQDCDYKPAHWYNDCFICVSGRIHMCAMTRIHMRHDSFTCVSCLISWGDMRRYLKIDTVTPSYVYHNLSTCVPWLVYMCTMTQSHVCNVLLAEAIWDDISRSRLQACMLVLWLNHTCAITYSHVRLRVVGSLKL